MNEFLDKMKKAMKTGAKKTAAWVKKTRAARKARPKDKRKRNRVLVILGTIIMIFAMTGAICATAFAVYVKTNIDTDFDVSFRNIKLDYTTTIYYTDENGTSKEYAKLYGTENRVWVDYDRIPEDLKKAIVAIEDERFWSHKGVDWKRTIGAMLKLVLTWDYGYGGSTITQQLIKNITAYDEVSIKRKVTEIMRALKVEQELSKEQILEYYLNTVNLGHGCYGVGSAALTYFGKDVSELDLAECASIAGITNLPYYYDAINYPEHNKQRQETILWKMNQLGMIDDEAYEAAFAEELVIRNPGDEEENETATGINSWFTDMLIEDIISDLQTEKGYSKSVATQLLYKGGLSIYATVEPKVQETMERVFANDANFQVLSTSIQPECAMIVYNNTGDIVGVVGGRGVKYRNRGLNRATMSKRQPGSSIKPIAVYAPAIEYGLITPYSVYDDSPLAYTVNGSFVDEKFVPKATVDEEGKEVPAPTKKVWPQNYYSPYRGLITVLEAVQDSTNTVAVRVLQELTVEKSFDFAKNTMGLKSLVEEKSVNGYTYTDIGLPQLALGGLTDGVTLRELVGAYVTFVNNGIYQKPRSYVKVVNSDGEILLNNVPELKMALSERTIFYMNTLLKRVVSHGTGTAAKISGIITAGKTGSTNDDKDRWFVGYTPYYVGGCWYGYDSPQVITGTSGNPALKAWKLVMDEIHKGKDKIDDFASNVETVTAEYCDCSGGIPSEICKADIRGSRISKGVFVKGDEPTGECTTHVWAAYDSGTKTLATSACPAGQVKSVGLLDVNRYYTVSGVKIKDEQYTLRLYGETGLPMSQIEGLKYYKPTPVLTSGQKVACNTFCSH